MEKYAQVLIIHLLKYLANREPTDQKFIHNLPTKFIRQLVWWGSFIHDHDIILPGINNTISGTGFSCLQILINCSCSHASLKSKSDPHISSVYCGLFVSPHSITNSVVLLLYCLRHFHISKKTSRTSIHKVEYKNSLTCSYRLQISNLRDLWRKFQGQTVSFCPLVLYSPLIIQRSNTTNCI